MIFGNRILREVTERDVRALVNARMAEHLQLEYKSARYEDNDRGSREFLQDICMFANAAGGVLLLGVHELRGEDGQPSGIPDPNADLGVASENPEAELQAYDARIVACIEERLPVESHAIPIEGGRFVIAFRVPSSLRKPHCVRFQNRVYFASRRERNRYEMDLREIKEQTMRAASQLQRAEQLLERELSRQIAVGWPSLFVAQLPVFHNDFLVDITRENIKGEIVSFDVSRDPPQRRMPAYTFAGLQRHDPEANTDLLLRRDGMLTLKAPNSRSATTQRESMAISDSIPRCSVARICHKSATILPFGGIGFAGNPQRGDSDGNAPPGFMGLRPQERASSGQRGAALRLPIHGDRRSYR